jgi:hypothetical protein
VYFIIRVLTRPHPFANPNPHFKPCFATATTADYADFTDTRSQQPRITPIFPDSRLPVLVTACPQWRVATVAGFAPARPDRRGDRGEIHACPSWSQPARSGGWRPWWDSPVFRLSSPLRPQSSVVCPLSEPEALRSRRPTSVLCPLPSVLSPSRRLYGAGGWFYPDRVPVSRRSLGEGGSSN